MSDERADEGEGEVLAARFGRSANCSSVGSVVDVLFVSSVVGTAILGALAVMVRGARDGERGEDPVEPETEGSDEDQAREG